MVALINEFTSREIQKKPKILTNIWEFSKAGIIKIINKNKEVLSVLISYDRYKELTKIEEEYWNKKIEEVSDEGWLEKNTKKIDSLDIYLNEVKKRVEEQHNAEKN